MGVPTQQPSTIAQCGTRPPLCVSSGFARGVLVDGAVGKRGKSMSEPIPILTVGDLKAELARWRDYTPITFHSPLREQEYRFYRFRRSGDALLIDLNAYPETPPAPSI